MKCTQYQKTEYEIKTFDKKLNRCIEIREYKS